MCMPGDPVPACVSMCVYSIYTVCMSLAGCDMIALCSSVYIKMKMHAFKAGKRTAAVEVRFSVCASTTFLCAKYNLCDSSERYPSFPLTPLCLITSFSWADHTPSQTRTHAQITHIQIME